MSPFAIIIPARFASTRFPGKPLAQLRGATGLSKSLIQRSWECAMAVPGASNVWVATDDERIAMEVATFGGKVVMTAPDCANGTERCAQALSILGDIAPIIVNLQGDAPLSPAAVVPQLVKRLEADEEAAMATPVVRCSPASLAHLRDDESAGRVGGTTAVFTREGRALYFSKRIIPYLPPDAPAQSTSVYLHLGLYAYRPEALARYRAAAASPLEQLEGLEQLRFLDEGLPVAVLPLDQLDWDPIELNNPSDTATIERILTARNIA